MIGKGLKATANGSALPRASTTGGYPAIRRRERRHSRRRRSGGPSTAIESTLIQE
jgi:hypothetical protein